MCVVARALTNSRGLSRTLSDVETFRYKPLAVHAARGELLYLLYLLYLHTKCVLVCGTQTAEGL